MEGYGALGAAAAADPLPLSSARPAAKRSGPLTAVAMALALLGVAAVALSSHGSGATVVPSAAALASEKRTGGNQSGSEVSDTSADDFTAGRDGNGRGGDMGDDFFDGGSRPSLDLTAAQLAAASAAVEAEATMVATGVPHPAVVRTTSPVSIASASGTTAAAEKNGALGALGGSAMKLEAQIVTDAHARMKLHAKVRITLRDATSADAPYIVAVRYAPTTKTDKLAPLWSRNATLSGDGTTLTGTINVFRLRPATEYEFHVFLSEGSESGVARLRTTLTATIPGTGIPRFDDFPLASIAAASGAPSELEGDVKPSWEMLSMVYGWFSTAGQSDQGFAGVVSIDQAGWVVWYYESNYDKTAGGHKGVPAIWDLLPATDSAAASIALLEVSYKRDYATTDSGERSEDGTHHWVSNAALVQASALGDLEEQYIQACTGTPMNYNALTHELRVDHTHPEKRVLTTAITLKRFNDEYVPLRIGASTGGGDDDPAAVLYDHENVFGGVEIVAWDRTGGTLNTLYDLFDYASPDDKGWLPETTTWTSLDGCHCAGDAKIDALDYHHISSVSVGLDGDLLVSSRNLNTIFCFDAKGGGGLKWTLSSISSKSDFTFERDLDKFYTPHDAMMLSDGKLLMIDDGSSRPGCVGNNGYAGCWSRAIMYELDFEKNTTTVVWQYQDPHSLNGDDDDRGATRAGTKTGADTRDLAADWGHKAEGGGGRSSDSGGTESDDGDDDDDDAAARALDDDTAIAAEEARGEGETDETEKARSNYYESEVMTRDGFNFDGGSASRLEDGRILVAFTSPYDNRLWNDKYSMHAYEVDKDGRAVIEIVVPHTGSLGSQGSYRFIPMKTVDMENTVAPFASVEGDDDDADDA